MMPRRLYRSKVIISSKGVPILRKCSSCLVVLPLSKFSPNKRGGTTATSAICRKCKNIQNVIYRNSPRGDFVDWRKAIKRKYGISPEHYHNILLKQGGVCAVCHKYQRTMKKKRKHRLCVDHDHETGRIRGLLCCDCNFAIKAIERGATAARLEEYLNPPTPQKTDCAC